MNFSDTYSLETDKAVAELKKLEKAQESANDAADHAEGKLGKFGEASEKAADASANLADGLFNLKEGGIEPAIGGLAGLAGVLGGPALQGAITAVLFLVLLFKDKLGELSDQLSGQSRKSIKDYMEGIDKLNAELEEVQASIQTYTDMQKLTIEQGKEYQKLRERESELNEQITKQTEEEAKAKAEIARLESLKEAKGKSADEKQALVERQIREAGGSEIGDIEKKLIEDETKQVKADAEARTKAIKENINKAPSATIIDGDSGPIRIGPEGSLTDEERSKALREAREREKNIVAKAEADARKRAQDLLIGLSKGDSGSIEALKNAGFKDSSLVKGVEQTLETGKTDADREAERIAEERAKRQKEDAARAERAKKKAAPAIQKAIKEATQAVADPFEQKRAEDEAAKEAAREQEAARKERAASWADRNQDLVDAARAARSTGQDPAKTDAALMREIERRSGYSRTGNKKKDEKTTSRVEMEKAALAEIKERAKEADSAIAESIESGVGRDNAILLYLNSIAERQLQIAQQNEQMRMRVAQARQNLAPSRPSILPTY